MNQIGVFSRFSQSRLLQDHSLKSPKNYRLANSAHRSKYTVQSSSSDAPHVTISHQSFQKWPLTAISAACIAAGLGIAAYASSKHFYPSPPVTDHNFQVIIHTYLGALTMGVALGKGTITTLKSRALGSATKIALLIGIIFGAANLFKRTALSLTMTPAQETGYIGMMGVGYAVEVIKMESSTQTLQAIELELVIIGASAVAIATNVRAAIQKILELLIGRSIINGILRR